MEASVVGLVGTAIGALGAVAGGWVSVLGQGRQQQRQLRADREPGLAGGGLRPLRDPAEAGDDEDPDE